MPDLPDEIKTGIYTVLYSNTFNLYSDTLTIGKILGYKFKFLLVKDTEREGGYEVKSHAKNKVITVKLFNFESPLGVAMTKPQEILKSRNTNKKVLFSVVGHSIGDNPATYQLTVTFYQYGS